MRILHTMLRVGDLEKSAKEHGLVLREKLDLPANNFILTFGRQ